MIDLTISLVDNVDPDQVVQKEFFDLSSHFFLIISALLNLLKIMLKYNGNNHLTHSIFINNVDPFQMVNKGI